MGSVAGSLRHRSLDYVVGAEECIVRLVHHFIARAHQFGRVLPGATDPASLSELAALTVWATGRLSFVGQVAFDN